MTTNKPGQTEKPIFITLTELFQQVAGRGLINKYRKMPFDANHTFTNFVDDSYGDGCSFTENGDGGQYPRRVDVKETTAQVKKKIAAARAALKP